jgi:hypothetical protein
VFDNIQSSTSNHPTNKIRDAVNQVNKPEQTENNEFNFEDILDVINPLHHIPIVSKVYQEHTQDEISNNAKSVGDMLYGVLTGGIFGGLSALGNTLIRQDTGKDISEHVIAYVSDDNADINTVTAINIDAEDELFDNNLTHQYQPNKQNLTDINPKDDFWSVRIKQLYGDDNFG